MATVRERSRVDGNGSVRMVMASVVALSVAQHFDPQTVDAKLLKMVDCADSIDSMFNC